MTQQSRGLALAAITTGLASLVLALVFLFSPAGSVVYWLALVVGVIAVLLGIVALVRRETKALAFIGLVAGAITTLWALGTLIFALVFVGAIAV